MPFMLITSIWCQSFMSTTVHVTLHAPLQGLKLMASHAKSSEQVMDWMLFSCLILWKINGLNVFLMPNLMNSIPKLMLINWSQVAGPTDGGHPWWSFLIGIWWLSFMDEWMGTVFRGLVFGSRDWTLLTLFTWGGVINPGSTLYFQGYCGVAQAGLGTTGARKQERKKASGMTMFHLNRYLNKSI